MLFEEMQHYIVMHNSEKSYGQILLSYLREYMKMTTPYPPQTWILKKRMYVIELDMLKINVTVIGETENGCQLFFIKSLNQHSRDSWLLGYMAWSVDVVSTSIRRLYDVDDVV